MSTAWDEETSLAVVPSTAVLAGLSVGL